MEWLLDIPFRGKQHVVRAVVEFKDEQFLRVRVYGSHSSVLVETEYQRTYEGKLRWRFLEGSMNTTGHEGVRLMFDIFDGLEYAVRIDIRS